MKFHQRCGWLGLSLVPILVSFVLQIVGSVVGIIVYTVYRIVGLTIKGVDQDTIIAMAQESVATDSIGMCLVIAHLLMIICFALWYYFGCGRPKLREAKGVFVPKMLLVVVLVCGGMCFFTNFGLPVASLVIPESIMTAYEKLMEQAGFGVDAFAIFASVCLAPFGEEFLCRGVVFHYAKKMVADLENRKKAFWIANSLQAVLFGVLHGNIIQGTYAFLMGLALGYLAQRFHSLVPCIFGHMLINATSTYAWEPIANALPESYAVYAFCAAVSLVVAFVGLYLGGPAKEKGMEING